MREKKKERAADVPKYQNKRRNVRKEGYITKREEHFTKPTEKDIL